MTERRSLSNALELSAEKMAFIRGTPLADDRQAESPEPGQRTPSSDSAVATEARVEATTPPKERQPRQRRTSGAAPGRRPVATSAAPSLDRFRVGLTVRIHPEISDALRRAQLEQKLRRQAPETQQEIVEIALEGWLQENGYLN